MRRRRRRVLARRKVRHPSPLVRALFDGELPIELSLRGARWKEGLFGFGGEFLARQENAEAQAVRADADRKEEIELLRGRLAEAVRLLEELTDQASERFEALEEVWVPGGKIEGDGGRGGQERE